MKHLTLTLLALLAFHFLSAQYCGNNGGPVSGPSVCAPSGNSPTGFTPTSENTPPLINGDPSSLVLQFHNFDTTRAAGQLVKIQQLRIDSIGNLPAGLCWSTNKANNTFINNEQGCFAFTGTTCATPGQYRLKLIVTPYIGNSSPGIPVLGSVDAGDLCGLYVYLRVNNSGDIEQVVDTNGQSMNTNIFQPYGGTADCNPLHVLSVNLGADKTICNGSNLTLNPARGGGQPPFTFMWSSTADTLSCTTCNYPTITVSQSSTYSVTVIDATGATASDAVTINPSGGTNQVQFTVTNTDIDCSHARDTTTVSVSGGTSPYTFNWGDGTTSSGNTPGSHIYTQAGTYVIGVSDMNNCVNSTANAIAFRGILISTLQTIRPLCPGLPTGKVKISASGGVAPYTFLWSNGATADSLINIAPGNYSVTVTDAASCTFSKYISLAPLNNWGFYAFTQPSASNCNSNGSITTTVSGGIPPYTFNWSNSSNTQNLSNLQGGVYTLTVTDSLGCPTNGQATVPTSCYSLITGSVFNDANNNCIMDNGEGEVNGVYIIATGNNGQTYYANAFNNGEYVLQIPAAGVFDLSASTSYYFGSCGNLSLCNNANHTVTINTIGDTSLNNNFGFVGSNGFDLTLHPTWSAGNPGFEKDYRIYFGNESQTNFIGQGSVVFSYDSNLIYQSSYPVAIHNFANHTLTWSIDSLPTNSYWWGDVVHCTFLVPQTMPLGYMLQSDFRITPTSGDCDSSNNHLHTADAVTGSYDPNEKIVEPAGRILEEDSVLTYTIGFQNTGTDSTHFIILKDTLSDNLDAGSVRNIASSHPYTEFNISGKGILTWTFNPLRLVDSFTNEKESHGFVKFSIKKKKNLPVGSIISNTAHIYFDYNPAVVTNTVADTVTEPNSVFDLRSADGITVRAFPNPFTGATNIVVDGLTQKFDFELYDVTGRMHKRIAAVETSQLQLQRDNLSAGVYFFKITSADKKKAGYGKLIVE